jgi:hypothetical protein
MSNEDLRQAGVELAAIAEAIAGEHPAPIGRLNTITRR